MKTGGYCKKCDCEMELIQEYKYKAFNGHVWTVSDYVCKKCGRKTSKETEFNTGLCIFDEKKQEIENKMKERLKEAIKDYEKDCKKLMKEISGMINKRWKKTKDKKQRQFDNLEADAFRYVCKSKLAPLQDLYMVK